LGHHAEVVSDGVVIHDLPISELVPVHVLDLEAITRRFDADQLPTVQRKTTDSVVRSGYPAADDDSVRVSRQADNLHLPIGERPVDVLEDATKPLTPD
jgi:hypothetical protein